MPVTGKPKQFRGASEVMDLIKESTTITLLNLYNSYYILKCILIPIDKCVYHPSSKKPLFIANRDYQRNSHAEIK